MPGESMDVPLITRQRGTMFRREPSWPSRREALVLRRPVVSVAPTRSRRRLFGHDANDGILNAFKMAHALFYEPDVPWDRRQNYKYYADQVIKALTILTTAYWPERLDAPHVRLARSRDAMHALFWSGAEESEASLPTHFSLKFDVTEKGIRVLAVAPGAVHGRVALKTSRGANWERARDIARRAAQSTQCWVSPIARTYTETLSVALDAREDGTANKLLDSVDNHVADDGRTERPTSVTCVFDENRKGVP